MTGTDDPEARLRDFEQQRAALFGLAYRMLGSAMDAEDMVQETFLRWQRTPTESIMSPRAFLMTTITRLCIDQLRSARSRREAYIGTWLPEPLVERATDQPGVTLDRADSLGFAFLLLLERLTPLERAAFLLHDVFGYSFDQVATFIGSNAPHCRQLAHRARSRVTAGRQRFDPSPVQAEQAARLFVRAATTGDLGGLLALFAEDIQLWSDGGGKVTAARNVIYGAQRTARFFVGISRKFELSLHYQAAIVNRMPGLLGYGADELRRVYSFDVDTDGRIRAIYTVLNPDKLRAIDRVTGAEIV